jgi:hypothetical protein
MDFQGAAVFAALAILGPTSVAAEPISFICAGMYSDVGEGIDKAPTGNTSLTVNLKEGWIRSPLLLGQVSIGRIFGDEVIFSRAEGPEGKPWEKQTSGSLNRVTGVLSFAKLYSTPNGEMGWTQRYELGCRPVRPIF